MDEKEVIKRLSAENDQLHLQNKQLIKVCEILAGATFRDCFMYLCDSQNECQTFGCRVQNKIKEMKNSSEFN